MSEGPVAQPPDASASHAADLSLSEILSEPAIAEAIQRHLLAWYPREACGLITQGPHGYRALLARNLADELHAADPDSFERCARRSFQLDPRLIVQAEARGERLTAIFHSHPDSGPEMSKADVAEALSPDESGPRFPGVRYLVFDLRGGIVGRFGVFAWDEPGRGFVELERWSGSGLPVKRG